MIRRKRCSLCGKLAKNLVKDTGKDDMDESYCRKCHNEMIKDSEEKLDHARKILGK